MDAFQKIRDICIDFEPYLKVHSLISVEHKGIKWSNDQSQRE